PVTFRTRKLSLTAPMVLHAGVCGRVGHRRTLFAGSPVGEEHHLTNGAFTRPDAVRACTAGTGASGGSGSARSGVGWVREPAPLLRLETQLPACVRWKVVMGEASAAGGSGP